MIRYSNGWKRPDRWPHSKNLQIFPTEMNASDFEKNRIRIPHRNALPLNRGNMPSGNEISLKHYTQNRSVRIPEDPGPRQSLKGFDPTYRNIIDYICLLYTSDAADDLL